MCRSAARRFRSRFRFRLGCQSRLVGGRLHLLLVVAFEMRAALVRREDGPAVGHVVGFLLALDDDAADDGRLARARLLARAGHGHVGSVSVRHVVQQAAALARDGARARRRRRERVVLARRSRRQRRRRFRFQRRGGRLRHRVVAGRGSSRGRRILPFQRRGSGASWLMFIVFDDGGR